MRVTRLQLRDFRSYERGELRLGPGLTVVAGRNGAGKTNLLEALYFACTGRSCKTANEREVVRFGARADPAGAGSERRPRRARDHGRLPARRGEAPARGRRGRRAADRRRRPARSCRSSCPTGSSSCSAPRRCAARTSTRSSPRCGRAAPARAAPTAPRSAQRNALIAGIRAGRAGRGSLPAWDAELARHGMALMRDRAEAVERLRPRFVTHAEDVGLEGEAELAYRPRSKAPDADALAAELAERVDGDVERGFTGHGPHRDDLAFRRAGPRAAHLRLARPAAARAAGAAAGRARRAGGRARRSPADAARRRDVRARRGPPRAARGGPARAAASPWSPPPTSRTCPAPRTPASSAWRSPAAACCRPRRVRTTRSSGRSPDEAPGHRARSAWRSTR